MKVLEITFDLRAGGAERFALDLSNELSKNNDVILLAIKNDTLDPQTTQFYKGELSNNVIYHNLGFGKGFSLKMAYEIYKYVKREKPDVVHLHGVGMPIYCFLAIALLNSKTKFYQTIHSDIYNGYTSLFYKVLFYLYGYRGKMGFIALSTTNYRDMMKEYPKTKGACIVNGRAPIIPTKQISAVKREIDSYKHHDDSKIFLHVARCNPVKNQLLLVKSFNAFVRKGFHAELVVIGADFDNELGRLICKESGIYIHFIGTRKNVGDYMLCADVFCLSSDFEGMPISMLEASLAGVPIVSTPVCGALDLIVNGKNGIVSTDHTTEQYIIALEEAYGQLEQLKANSKELSINSPYTIVECAKKYIVFFKS